MKVIFCTDVHANRPALEALLRVVKREGYDLFIHGGDVLAIGPEPEACLAQLLALPRTWLLQGNHDAYFATGLTEPYPDAMSPGELRHQRWTHSRLDPALRAVVGAWPAEARLMLAGRQVYFCHYPRQADGTFHPFVADPSPVALDALFAGVGADLLFYGHDHRPVDLTGAARYVNPGALGCAPTASARYVILQTAGERLSLTHHAVPYDDSALWDAYSARSVPERAFLARVFHGGRRTLAE